MLVALGFFCLGDSFLNFTYLHSNGLSSAVQDCAHHSKRFYSNIG